ncbi:GTPase HflX [bacterium]|nr:GTPase HflX [bacterium]
MEFKNDKAFLVGIVKPGEKISIGEDSLVELRSLSDTSGVHVIGETLAVLRKITPATFIGSGKMEELAMLVAEKCASVVIVDTNLSPAQNRNLEEGLKVRVIDRTSLILDIFAQHATSREGKLQVELAQYEYLYPRLTGMWTHLSKQRGGGVGLRGPGETQLEVDRRRARERMVHVKKNLEKVSQSRSLHREKRETIPIPTVTFVGYTNAGKSTLFNALCKADVLAEDKLFATLDPKTKKIRLPSNREVLFTDTVGFIRNLPHQLVESFKSTFEEARASNLLLHVIDYSRDDYKEHKKVVEDVLAELELSSIPMLNVYNKIDLKDLEPRQEDDNVYISASKKDGLHLLLTAIDSALSSRYPLVHMFLPYPYGAVLRDLYNHGKVEWTKNQENGVELMVAIPEKWVKKYQAYVI